MQPRPKLDPSQYTFPPHHDANHVRGANMKELVLQHKTPDIANIMTRLMIVFILFMNIFLIILLI